MMDVTPFLEVRPAPRAVFDRLEESADKPRFYRRGDGGDWVGVTWGEFAEQIRKVALYLAAHQFRPGDRAAIFAHNSVEWAAAALGIQSAGGVMVPIYPASTPDQARYVIDHSDAKFLFVDDAAGAAAIDTIVLGEGPAAEDCTPWPQIMNQPDDANAFDRLLSAVDTGDVGLMLYTSGTSGQPKGVPLTHENVGINSRGWLVCNQQDLHEDATDLLWLPMSHIFGFGEMCLGNTLGFTSYLSSPRDALDLLPEIRPTVFMSVPAYWEKLARKAQAATNPAAALREVTGGRMQFCLSGGAGLKREVKELFYSIDVLIIEGYGLTETSPTLTLNRRDAFRFDSVGKPIECVELRLAGDGEIEARGPSVFSGYHKNPEATAEAFTSDGWFKTGDVGRFTDDGFLQIVDRKKDILVTAGGKNVPPANIEIQFRDDPLLEHVVVYGDGKKYLVAGVWLGQTDDAIALTAGDARSAVAARIEGVNATLARHETIKRFCIIDTPLTVDAGLLTASLKLRRKKVYEAFRDQFEALYNAAEAAG